MDDAPRRERGVMVRYVAAMLAWSVCVAGAGAVTFTGTKMMRVRLQDRRAIAFATHDQQLGAAILAIVHKYPPNNALVRYIPVARGASRDYGAMPILRVRQIGRVLVGAGITGAGTVAGANVSDYVTIVSTSSNHAIQVTNSVVTDNAFFNSVIYTATNSNNATNSSNATNGTNSTSGTSGNSDASSSGNSGTQSDTSTQSDSSTQSNTSTQGDSGTSSTNGTSTTSSSLRQGLSELAEIDAVLLQYDASVYQAYAIGSRAAQPVTREYLLKGGAALPRALPQPAAMPKGR